MVRFSRLAAQSVVPLILWHVDQNPAFGPAQVRELTSIFVEKAAEVCCCATGHLLQS